MFCFFIEQTVSFPSKFNYQDDMNNIAVVNSNVKCPQNSPENVHISILILVRMYYCLVRNHRRMIWVAESCNNMNSFQVSLSCYVLSLTWENIQQLDQLRSKVLPNIDNILPPTVILSSREEWICFLSSKITMFIGEGTFFLRRIYNTKASTFSQWW